MSSTELWLAIQEKAEKLQIENPSWRRGQSLFNALYMTRPKLADEIRGTANDPFYDDSRENSFIDVVIYNG